MKTSKNIPTWVQHLLFLLIVIIAAGGIGVAGASWTYTQLFDYSVGVSNAPQPVRPRELQPRALPDSIRESVEQFQKTLLSGTITFYRSTDRSKYGFVPDEAIAHGTPITSDGWVLVMGDLPKSMIAIRDGEEVEIEEAVEDPFSPATFVRLNAHGLKISAFGTGGQLQAGDQVLVSSSASALHVDMVRSHAVLPTPAPAIQGTRTIRLNESYAIGSRVHALSSDLLGFVWEDENGQQLIPIEAILPSFQSYLEEGEITRSGLPIRTLMLSATQAMDEELTRGFEEGALVTAIDSSQETGIKIGDILLAVDGRTIQSGSHLSEYLWEYEPNETVALSLDRDGTRQEVDVKLAPLADGTVY